MEEGGLGAGQMLGVHNERMEQRGEKETQGRGGITPLQPQPGTMGRLHNGEDPVHPDPSLPSQPH